SLAGILSFLFFLHSEYGSWSPNRIYWGWENQRTLLDLIREEGFQRVWIMIRMSLGFWIDQRFGLIPYAPLYIAFFPGLIWSLRTDREYSFPLTLLLAAHFAALCWGAPLGGFAPPSRHWVVLLPAVLYFILPLYDVWKRWQRWLFLVLALVSLATSFVMF